MSLLEIIISLAILALLSSLSMLSITSNINQTRQTTSEKKLIQLIQHGRAQAIASHERVVLCPLGENNHCDGDWQSTLTLFIDSDHNGQTGLGETIIAQLLPSRAWHYHGLLKQQIIFSANGNTTPGRFESANTQIKWNRFGHLTSTRS